MASPTADPVRRALVRGAAWSVPVVAVATAAPAFAASLCTKTALLPVTWSSTYTTTTQTGTTTAGVNVNVSASYTAGAGGGSLGGANLTPSNVPGTRDSISLVNNSPAGLLLPAENSFQTVSFVFTRPVFGLTFFIDDIDQSVTSYQDRVALSGTPLENPGRVAGSGALVVGAGTLADPWRTSGGAGDNAAGQTVQAVFLDATVGMTSLSLRFWSNQLPLLSVGHVVRIRQMQFRTCA